MDEQRSDSDSDPQDPQDLPNDKLGQDASPLPADPLADQEHDALGWLADDVAPTPMEEMPTMQWREELAEALGATAKLDSVNDEEPIGHTAAADMLRDDGVQEQEAVEVDNEPGDSSPVAEPDNQEPTAEPAEDIETTPIAQTTAPISAADEDEIQESGAATQLEAAVDPAAEQPAEAVQPEPIDNIEDAMLWLERLASGQGTPIEEMPTMVSGSADAAASDQAHVTREDSGASGGPRVVNEPESFEDPVDWLERLAADQTSPLDELPSVADRLLASDVISQVEDSGNGRAQATGPNMEHELSGAIAYLAAIAKRQGIDLDALSPVADNHGGDSPSLEDLDELASPQESVPQAFVGASLAEQLADTDQTDELLAQPPKDTDETLAWLGDLSEDSEQSDDEEVQRSEKQEIVHEAETPARSMSVPDYDELLEDEDLDLALAEGDDEDLLVEDEDLGEGSQAGPAEELTPEEVDDAWSQGDLLDDMPDDPDQMMAWMRDHGQQAAIEVDAPDEATEEAAKTNSEHRDMPAEDTSKKTDAVSETYVETLEASFNSADDKSNVIGELEQAVAEHPAEPRLRRLLGDAYLETGQMEKALEIYRQGFDHL